MNMMNETSTLKQMKNDFFKSFDIVRDVISHEEYWSVLFLLSAYKDNVVFKYLNIQSNLLINSSNQDKDLIKKYDQLFEVVEPIINRIGEQRLYRLIEVFHSFDTAFLNDNFSQLFEVFLQEINLYQGKFSDTVSQPKELTEFMCQLAQFENAKSIYNPFSGYASFGLSLNEGQQFFGQEINRKTWAVGQLHLLANKTGSNVQIKCEDVIDNFPNKNQQFDLIISHPPFNSLRDRNISGRWIKKYVSAEQFLIENGINLLTSKGKMILVVPSRFLSLQGGSEHIIQNLVGKDLIDTIVSFPGGVLSGTSIPTSVVLLNNKKENSDQIRFVDASLFIVEQNKFQKTINVNDLLKSIDNDASLAIRNIDKSVIVENDYDLSLQRYFTNLDDFRSDKNSRLISLKEILTSIPKSRVNPSNGKVIKIGDLSNDKFNYNIDVELLNTAEIDKSYYQINKPVLLIAKTFNRLKPSYCVASDDNSVYVSQNIEAFTISSNVIELPYLIMQLNSDFVQKQLELSSNGAVYPNLKVSDILNIKIEIPNLGIQESIVRQIALVEGAKLQFDKDAIEKLQLQNTINTLVQERVNDFQWALHDIRNGDLLAITNKVSILTKLSNIDNKMQEIVIDEKKGITLRTLVLALNENVKRLAQSLTEMYESSERFGEQEKIDVIQFIESFISSQDILDKERFVFDNTEMESIFDEQKKNGKSIYIDFNNIDLKQILVNIFENIKRHSGFVENQHLDKNKIKILLSLDKQELSLSVLNSGKINKINMSDYFSNGGRFGENANSGKGGYIIKVRAERNNAHVFQKYYDEYEAMGYVFEVGFKTKYYLNEK